LAGNHNPPHPTVHVRRVLTKVFQPVAYLKRCSLWFALHVVPP
jgi:hypothetical protein